MSQHDIARQGDVYSQPDIAAGRPPFRARPPAPVGYRWRKGSVSSARGSWDCAASRGETPEFSPLEPNVPRRAKEAAALAALSIADWKGARTPCQP